MDRSNMQNLSFVRVSEHDDTMKQRHIVLYGYYLKLPDGNEYIIPNSKEINRNNLNSYLIPVKDTWRLDRFVGYSDSFDGDGDIIFENDLLYIYDDIEHDGKRVLAKIVIGVVRIDNLRGVIYGNHHNPDSISNEVYILQRLVDDPEMANRYEGNIIGYFDGSDIYHKEKSNLPINI